MELWFKVMFVLHLPTIHFLITYLRLVFQQRLRFDLSLLTVRARWQLQMLLSHHRSDRLGGAV